MRDVQETLRKLKPIIGKKADQFWLAYLTEDRAGIAELETVLNLWADQLLGNNIDSNHTQLTVPSREMASGEYPIGSVTYACKTLFPFAPVAHALGVLPMSRYTCYLCQRTHKGSWQRGEDQDGFPLSRE